MLDKKEPIAIASDHAGFDLKDHLIGYLLDAGYIVNDLGTYSPESVDYPDFAHQLGRLIDNGTFKRGIVMCGSGNGVNMVVNKYPHVRSGLAWNAEQAKLTRMHNDANVLALPGRFIEFSEAEKAVDNFLNTEFEGGRHQNRVNKVPITGE